MNEPRLIGELARVCRSKNAGMALLTIDLIFSDEASYELGKGSLDPRVVAERYAVEEADVDIVHWPAARAIKITMPRWMRSGSEGDRDVYGCQQHRPIWEIPVAHGNGQAAEESP